MLNRLNNHLNQKVRDNVQHITPEERQAILEKFRKDYNIDVAHGKVNDVIYDMQMDGNFAQPGNALASRGMGFAELRDFFTENPHLMAEQKGKVVLSVDGKDRLLHELGHATDDKLIPTLKAAHGLNTFAPVASGLGANVLANNAMKHNANNSEEEQKSAVKGGLIGTGIGVGMGLGSGALVERTEDRANAFVKDYMTKELGDKKLAKEWFNNSSLPHGRNTYRVGTAARGIVPLATGLAGGAVGAGIGAARYGGQDKEASFAMQALYK